MNCNTIQEARDLILPGVMAVARDMSADIDLMIDFVDDNLVLAVYRPGGYDKKRMSLSYLNGLDTGRKVSDVIREFVSGGKIVTTDTCKPVTNDDIIAIRDVLLPYIHFMCGDKIEGDLRCDLPDKDVVVVMWVEATRTLLKRSITNASIRDGSWFRKIRFMVREMIAECVVAA